MNISILNFQTFQSNDAFFSYRMLYCVMVEINEKRKQTTPQKYNTQKNILSAFCIDIYAHPIFIDIDCNVKNCAQIATFHHYDI